LAVILPLGPAPGPGPECASRLDGGQPPRRAPQGPYAALDLGTNNCRLLIARPTGEGFRVIDSFSRIVRLGEGLSQTGRLSEAAIARTIGALSVCRDKMRAQGVARARMIATEACRSAANGAQFLEEVHARLGIQLEIVDRETEARLAAAGCGPLADRNARSIVLFDIGGGSSEIVWLSDEKRPDEERSGSSTAKRIRAWESLRLGVVTLAEMFGGHEVSDETFVSMTKFVGDQLAPFSDRVAGEARCSHFHLLGTSGTVTTIAGVHLNLPRYDRRQIDGLWLTSGEVDATIGRLRAMTFAQRSANPCIGNERADLVLAGCAILEAIRQSFPAERIRIADRGLREGMLTQLMSADRHGSQANRMGH
jgi:exopolyphosphatase / guanosine-5'-triphosphate,3'-diphosphate pyrophosphatase